MLRFIKQVVNQWFPNYGTRRSARWYPSRPTFCFS